LEAREPLVHLVPADLDEFELDLFDLAAELGLGRLADGSPPVFGGVDSRA
jgi:hypothetical protein